MPEARRSVFQEAAGLPIEAPHILKLGVSETNKPADTSDAACEIDIDDFEAALRDPNWRAFCKEALEYHRQLVADGRSS